MTLIAPGTKQDPSSRYILDIIDRLEEVETGHGGGNSGGGGGDEDVWLWFHNVVRMREIGSLPNSNFKYWIVSPTDPMGFKFTSVNAVSGSSLVVREHLRNVRKNQDDDVNGQPVQPVLSLLPSMESSNIASSSSS